MFKFQTNETSGILHLIVTERGTIEDYQDVLPDVVHQLKSQKLDKFLLEIAGLEEPKDYIDPNLAFFAVNEIKLWIAKMAVVCPASLLERVEPLVQPVRNYGRPVRVFTRVGDALKWLQPTSCGFGPGTLRRSIR